MTSLTPILEDSTDILAAKMEALSMRMSNLESLFLPNIPSVTEPHPIALLSTMNRSLSECLSLIERTECELREEIDRVQHELKALLDSKVGSVSTLASDALARVDSLEVARSGDVSRIDKLAKDVNMLKRVDRKEAQAQNKTRELAQHMVELRHDNHKLRVEVESLSETFGDLDKRFASNSSLAEIQKRVHTVDEVAQRFDQTDRSVKLVNEEVLQLKERLLLSENSREDEIGAVRTGLAALQTSITADLDTLKLKFEQLENSRWCPSFDEAQRLDDHPQGPDVVPGVASLQKISLEVKNMARGGYVRSSYGST
ncbi:hypothetical protein FOZ63_001075 [Perkinsus olseni]|uniref:Uncharacterized protein n=1 Tax=Perkinsus olseni TaxID=32597 RepID=A0A7J6TNX4_PEROL|nr:hypothetical protein FOZ63_001075 [Perkinsus olseni]